MEQNEEQTQQTQSTNNYVIGIDLGTTYSCVSVYRKGQAEIICNDQGERTTPSYVTIVKDQVLVGQSSKNSYKKYPNNTLYDVKRLIGKKYSDKTNDLTKQVNHLQYKVVEKNDVPLIELQLDENETKQYHPEQVSSHVLQYLKKMAEQYLGCPVTKAVITVPAYFNDQQRKNTQLAGKIAGLEVLRIINEPTAAALAYGIDKQQSKSQNVVVYDLGGGTLDVSVLQIEDGVFEVLATSGDTNLGGEDFDRNIQNHVLDQFCTQNKVNRNDVQSKNLARLKQVCENSKKQLSFQKQVTVSLDSFHDGKDLEVEVTQSKFEEVCNDQFKKCMQSVDEAMVHSKLSKSQIDKVILVGGSTRIPKVQQLLSQYFNLTVDQLNKSVNPDEAVAVGAAIQGFILSGQTDDKTDQIVLIDAVPLSIGIETAGGVFTPIIEKGTSIPCSKEELFTTFQDNQPGVTITVFEGLRQFVKDNNKLGQFNLDGIPPMGKGVPKIKITLSVDANSILDVRAECQCGSELKKQELKINNVGSISKEEVERMVNEANANQELDSKRKQYVEKKNVLQTQLFDCKSFWQNVTSDKNKEFVKQYLDEVPLERKDKEQYQDKSDVDYLYTKYLKKCQKYETQLTGLQFDNLDQVDTFDKLQTKFDTKVKSVFEKVCSYNKEQQKQQMPEGMPDMSGMGGMPNMDQMSEMMKDPKMKEMMENMMKSQTPQQTPQQQEDTVE